MKKLGIIGAMDAEITLLKEYIQDTAAVSEIAGISFYEGMLGGINVVVAKSGIGKVNAALCTQIMILKFGADTIINTGIAGAIDEKLHVFDFVVSADTIYHDADAVFFGYESCTLPGMPRVFPADASLVQAAETAFKKQKKDFKLHTGRIASGDCFIHSAEKKQAIKSACNPACVEMEGCAIAQTCYVHKVPFVIIRCMSDTADIREKAEYDFNETTAAELCADFVRSIIQELSVI